jgi:hypothetical protein
MLDFIVKNDEKISEANYIIWISFTDRRVNKSTFYLCSGTALVIQDDENKCWFDFHFYHRPGWEEIARLRIDAPAYLFTEEELLELGKMTAGLINQYIAKHN